jgi:diguanylate cyclase (GGDEF)-like protein
MDQTPASRTPRRDRTAHTTLPTATAVLAHVVRIAGDTDRPIIELGQACALDSGLTVELLRAANSACQRSGDPIRSVPAAVIQLGARAVRAAAITYTLRTAVSGLPLKEFDIRGFWEDSLRRAAAAQLIAEETGYEDPHEAFAVGLTQEIGTLLLAARNPGASGHLQRLRNRPSQTRIEAEAVLTGQSHPVALVESGLLENLPPSYRFAIRHHHAPPAGRTAKHRLARIAQAADLLADVVLAFPKRRCLMDANRALAALGLSGRLPVLVDTLAARVLRHARDFEMDVGEQPGMESVREAAAAALKRLDREGPLPALKLEPPPVRPVRGPLRRDALTGLLGHRAFRVELSARARQKGRVLSLLLIDLDHLSRINDAFGREAGDHVLKQVADQIRRVAGGRDQVARIGGEAFALLLVDLDGRRARRIGEQLRRVVAGLTLPWADAQLHLTISIGGATTTGSTQAEALVSAADQALYRAKHEGRDRVRWDGEAPCPAVDVPGVSGAA